ncbi:MULTISPECIES: lipoprotein-releasing ABC transporter permease subunit [Bartonella]|uniref:lipoprotein-releasing ABC transporter permease subunit n=1 Tax=Bartonella TaxID=773 RepID=UPI0018DCF4F1|nr:MULTISPECIES: lipoprotein-releasing ABC transporter permease subunit [Bartonella]MBH9994422.1 lipoprotein-releasing ABC transporter permease subunit [Bartonella sp. P0291]MBH9997233.1 lipoprotein-releasing ABC transporter permease subunit [Bartonella sp. M0192]MBH9999393.1 lipoprotein-releasing ABC transporter permease subunit [Bartonella sp. M0191]MBI0007125.1 lipoprotein-releasing ABC transporter permease subunit [Bartonella sp. M0193]MBI0010684.1 lipoprotein-releasing ABC transporter per
MSTRAKGVSRLRFLSYEWMIAFRYMLPNRKQMFTSVISIISLIGIMLGVFALIVVMAVMNGFRTELLDRILGMNGHLVIQAIDSDFTDYNTLIPRIEGVDGVKFALPVIEGQAMAQGEAAGGTGALVRGLRKQDLDKLTTVTKNIKSGSLDDFDKQDGVAIGSGMAEKLGLSVGSDIRIVTPDGDVTPFGVTPRVKAYKVAAIFTVGMSEYDTIFVFMPLKEAQAFFNLGNKVQSLEIFLNDPDAVDKISPEIEKAVGRQVYSIDWRSRNQAFFSALQVERNVMFFILSLIVLVAALNIISGLIMLVKDKGHDIAILRTMGAKQSAVMRIFIMTGMVIGVIGTVLGLLLGVLTCENIGHIQDFISWLFNVDVFNPQLYFLTKLPARLEWGQTLIVVFMALFLSFLATLIPAWRAAKLDPVQALRYE